MIPLDWAINPPPKAALQVFIVIWDNLDERHRCWLTQRQLTRICGVSRSAIQQGIAWLVESRALEVRKGSGHASSLFAVKWNNSKPARAYNAAILTEVDDRKSTPQGYGKQHPRGSKNNTPEDRKSTPPSQPDLLNHKDISKDISRVNKENKASAPARARRAESEATQLRVMLIKISHQAHREGEALPGKNPPKCHKLTAKRDGNIKALTTELVKADHWDAYGDLEGRLLEYFRRCYFRAWNRGLAEPGRTGWNLARFAWFLENWGRCVEWANTSEEMRAHTMSLAQTPAVDIQQRLDAAFGGQ